MWIRICIIVLSILYISTTANHGPVTIHCRMSEEDFERLLADGSEFKINTTHTVDTDWNTEMVRNLTVCDFTNGGDPNLQPHALVTKPDLVKRVLTISNLDTYLLLFELVKENGTLCEKTTSEALRLACLLANHIPKITSALIPSSYSTVVDETTGSTMIDLRNNSWVNAFDKINILKDQKSNENKSALLEYIGFNSSISDTIEYNAQKTAENPNRLGSISETFFPYTSSVYSKHFANDPTKDKNKQQDHKRKQNSKHDSSWKKEDLLRYVQSEEFNDKIASFRHPDNWRAIPMVINIGTNIYNTIGDPIGKLWKLVKKQPKRIHRYYSAMFGHYSDVFTTFHNEVEKKNKEIESKGGLRKLELDKLSFGEWSHLYLNLIETHDFRKTSEYYHTLRGRSPEILRRSWKETGVMDWTSFADPDNKFRFTLSDIAYGVKCGFCWLFKRWIDCCNEGGCNLGVPKFIDPAKLGCSLPEFEAQTNFTILPSDINPDNLGCDTYDKFTGYFQALTWVLFAQTLSGVAQLHNGWIPYLDWFYTNINGSLPSNIYWCMIAKARVGFVIFIIIGLVTFALLFLGMIAGVIHIYFMVRHQKYMEKVRNTTGRNAGLWVWDEENKKWYRDMNERQEAEVKPRDELESVVESQIGSRFDFSSFRAPSNESKMQVVYVRVEHDPVHMAEEEDQTQESSLIGEILDETNHLFHLGHAFLVGAPTDESHLHHE